MEFESIYKSLNKAQKEAVDTIDGPVLVIAGPGTGKTQLLATRAANILKKDSTLLPTNILCLTFTESGQVAMQRRLIELMGESGAHVAVHTFHSFGTEIINQYPQYFYQGANYSPADELTTHEILVEILENLSFRNPLATKNQNEFVYLKSIKSRLAELKKAALTPDEFRELIKDNLKFVDFIEPIIIELFDVTSFSKKEDIVRASKSLDIAKSYKQPSLKVSGYKPLKDVFIDTFGEAVEKAETLNKPKPINDWKKDWFARDRRNKAICKQREILDKLLSLADVYEKYQSSLESRKLFDFDDMIVRVVQALETRKDLAFELQEQYQYFLVDEFQDTNAGQLRMLNALADHPVNEGRPNILVVGDDDQAIYAFQGAELNNILGFKEAYSDVKLITLTDNYRSSTKILDVSRNIITQGIDRLETRFNDIDKTLVAKINPSPSVIERQLFNTQAHEYEWIAKHISRQIKNGQDPKEIAVICREHKYLENLLPYLYDLGIPVAYERRQNALDNREIEELITLSKTVDAISKQRIDEANGLLPQLLSCDFWQINATDIWKLSLASHLFFQENHQPAYWIDLMLNGDYGSKLKLAAEFLLDAAKLSHNHSLEQVIDFLVGNTSFSTNEESYQENDLSDIKTKLTSISPYKNYYFNSETLKNKTEEYLALLSSLSAIRNQLRRYRADTKLSLSDFVYFVELCRQAGVTINVPGLHGNVNEAIQLMSAHGSKGLEFETVYLISAVNKVWDTKGRGSLLTLAPNMYSIAHTENQDDNLRLFYVAMTRAKRQLYISGYLRNDDNKEVTAFGALEDSTVKQYMPSPEKLDNFKEDDELRVRLTERQWYDRHYQLPKSTMQVLLSSRLQNYHLSVTHLNNFLDVTRGGPINFLLGNLLQFPAAMSPSAAFGSSIHETLEHLHKFVNTHSKFPNSKELIEYFEASLKLKRLATTEEKLYLERGRSCIKSFIEQRQKLVKPSQIAEQNFFSQGVLVNDARLTGKLDVIEISKLNANVIDYKTGAALTDWEIRNKSLYEKIKIHNYKRQLYFYKLLIDNSRSWGDKGIKLISGELVFVEPNKQNSISSIQLNLEDSFEIERLKKLISAVWQRIQNLDFPEVSNYEQNANGIIDFEDYLIGS